MAVQDWIAVVLLILASSAFAYMLGRRRHTIEPSQPVEAPPASSPEAAKPPEPAPPSDLLRMEYEEDSDVDPTRVGVGAKPPPEPRTVYQPPLVRLVYDEDGDNDEPTSAKALFTMHATAQTDTGQRRKRNEDSLLVLEEHGLFVIADGMGGYKGGELASQLAVKTVGEAFTTGKFEGAPHEGVAKHATNLARAIQMSNASILELAKRTPELEGMGTTMCAALFTPNRQRLYIGHVGDSRCYRMRDGAMKQMTNDHTMLAHGVRGPKSGELSRAVGIWPTVPIDIVFGVPQPGDVYLLCSDGLTKMLSDDIIANVMRTEEDAKEAVERLVFFANSRGGRDNITVILIRIFAPATASAAKKTAPA